MPGPAPRLANAKSQPSSFDPEFLDAIKVQPPPRLAPGVLRRSRPRSAADPLLSFLDDSLARYATRLRAWGEGALLELRPMGETAAVDGGSGPELAGLDALIAKCGGAYDARPDPSQERTPQNVA